MRKNGPPLARLTTLPRKDSASRQAFVVLPVVYVAGIAILVLSGVGLRSSAVLVSAVAVQTTTGAAWWAALCGRTRTSVVELAGLGIAFGTLAALASAQAFSSLPAASWAWVVPSVVTAGVLATLIFIICFKSKFQR